MACEVEWIPLGDIVNLSSGGTPDKKQPAYWDGEIPWISAKTLTGDTVTTSNLFITEEGLHAGSKLAPVGSILLLTRGSGLFKRIPLAIVNAPVAYNQDVKCMTSKVTTITNEYVFFALKALSPELTNMLETTGIGAGKLATDRLLDMPIPVLSHDEREKAVSFFSALSRKIMINNRINDYLEQLCQSLFDRFDNDENNLFVKVSDIADVNPRRTLKKGEEALCVEMADLSTTGAFPTDWRTKAYNGGVKFVNGDTILARITPCLENGKAGYINFLEQDEVAFGSTEYIVLTSKGELPSEFFYFLARNEDFISYATAHMNGSSGRQRVSGADVGNYEVRMPSEKQVSEFKEIAGKAMRVISASSIESRKLAQSRDALLPKLMSGEIDVSEVDLTQPTNNHLADC